jgi:hypothetical protein
MPTPLAYGDQLYTLANQGLFDAYDHRRRRGLPAAPPRTGSGFSASPVASDGRLFVASKTATSSSSKPGRRSSCWRKTR